MIQIKKKHKKFYLKAKGSDIKYLVRCLAFRSTEHETSETPNDIKSPF